MPILSCLFIHICFVTAVNTLIPSNASEKQGYVLNFFESLHVALNTYTIFKFQRLSFVAVNLTFLTELLQSFNKFKSRKPDRFLKSTVIGTWCLKTIRKHEILLYHLRHREHFFKFGHRLLL